jgi:hypothetical protein
MLTDRKLFLQFERSAVCLNDWAAGRAYRRWLPGVPGLVSAFSPTNAW